MTRREKDFRRQRKSGDYPASSSRTALIGKDDPKELNLALPANYLSRDLFFLVKFTTPELEGTFSILSHLVGACNRHVVAEFKASNRDIPGVDITKFKEETKQLSVIFKTHSETRTRVSGWPPTRRTRLRLAARKSR